MKFVFLVAALLVLNITFATQSLVKGQFLYNNLTIGQGQLIAIGINTSPSTDLLVIPSSDLSSFLYGKKVHAYYNLTVNSGIYYVNVPAGTYTVIAKALESTKVDLGPIAIPSADNGSSISISGTRVINFSLTNFTNVKISILSPDDYSGQPFVLNFSGTETVVSASTNLYYAVLSLNRGKHNITITTPSAMTFLLALNYTPLLVNPLAETTPDTNYSIGVASYGLYNISGTLHPYQVQTPEVIGIANMSLLAAKSTNPGPNASANGASLQLNT